jgi:L-gulonate 3-dehydrogenase
MQVGIVGLGLIGAGWARLVAEKGWSVRLFDADQARVRSVAASIEHQTTVVECATLEDLVVGVSFVQENLPEDVGIKRATFTELDRLADPSVVLASSASSLPMSAIAAQTVHPERCIVAHPMNPPDLIPVVEVVPSPLTNTATVERTREMMRDLGRVIVECEREIAGFVINRLQCALEREAFALVHSGAATAAAVERAVKDGLGPRWAALGPFGVEATNGETLAITLEKFAGGSRGGSDRRDPTQAAHRRAGRRAALAPHPERQ